MANELDLADAQLIGFNYGKWHHTDIIGLVESMGMTKSEWMKWKEGYPPTIDENDMKEIDKHFGV